MIPKVSRVAILGNSSNTGNAPQLRLAEERAASIGLTLQLVDARVPGDIENAFTEMTKQRAGAVIILADPMLIDQRTRIAELAAMRRLPSVGGQIEYAEAGGLMSYGPNFADMFKRAAAYVHKILNGARPGTLPIEQPTKFEIVVNASTARAFGISIPQSLRMRADRIIQ